MCALEARFSTKHFDARACARLHPGVVRRPHLAQRREAPAASGEGEGASAVAARTLCYLMSDLRDAHVARSSTRRLEDAARPLSAVRAVSPSSRHRREL